jgi:hypothetical protein
MLSGLTTVNPQNANVRNIAGVETNLTPGQINALIQAVGSNPQIQRNAAMLTQQLRQRRMIGANQQVVGLANGNALVASNAQIAGAVFTPQMTSMVTGLANANAQTLNVRGVTNADLLLNRNQVSALFETINNNPQARQIADRLTMNMLAEGRIRADQRVIGLQNGQLIVTAPSR